MTITVKRIAENLYSVSAKAAEWRGGEEWSPKQPMDGRRLVEKLARRGFHVQDICESMAEADPQWQRKLV
jgi:SOS response regulatory protein OraA/RecX